MNLKLMEIQRALENCVEKISIRSHGSAEIVFAANNGRTAEISVHNNGFWLELWEPCNDDAADSFQQIDVATAELAIDKAMAWLVQ